MYVDAHCDDHNQRDNRQLKKQRIRNTLTSLTMMMRLLTLSVTNCASRRVIFCMGTSLRCPKEVVCVNICTTSPTSSVSVNQANAMLTVARTLITQQPDHFSSKIRM